MAEQISETYNIHYLRMDEAQWEALSRAYEKLPEFVGYFGGIPFWFGLEPDEAEGEQDVSAKYLWASVEPSGLLVEGHLSLGDWVRWREAFVSQASLVLGFTIMAAEDDHEWPYGPVQ